MFLFGGEIIVDNGLLFRLIPMLGMGPTILSHQQRMTGFGGTQPTFGVSMSRMERVGQTKPTNTPVREADTISTMTIK